MNAETKDLNILPRQAGLDLPLGWLEHGTAVINADGLILSASPELMNWLGLPQDKVRPHSLRSVLVQLFPDWEAPLCDWEKRRLPFDRLLLCARKNHPPHWLVLESARHEELCFVRLSSTLPPLNELAEGAWDEQLRSEEARRQMFMRMARAEARLHHLMHHWPGIIYSQRADFSFSFISPQMEILTGVPLAEWRVQPGRFWQVIHEADVEELRQQIRQAAASGQPVTTTFRLRHQQSGRVFYILEHRQPVLTEQGLVLGYEGVWLDITRQTIAENRLTTASWKEALSVLMMGLAHDFSNLMAGIHSLTETLGVQLEENQHPCREYVKLIQNSTRQATHLVQRIMRLQHGKIGERSYEDLNALMADLQDLLAKVVSRRVQVKSRWSEGQLPIYVDPVEFRQVVVNLALNAAEAMPQGGTLTLETCRHASMPAHEVAVGTIPRGPCVCLSVSDTGCGIKSSVLPLIFDPFFSTKSANKGSGLGLYNARLFVERHHGAISVESVEGKGSTFRIWLPEADFTEAERQKAQKAPMRLLVVGDLPAQTQAAAELLRQNGYSVVTAASAEQAREMLTSVVARFAGVVLLCGQESGWVGDLLAWMQANRQHEKTILHVVGRNLDEMDTAFLNRADLVITEDLRTATTLNRMHNLLHPQAEGRL
ncbi:MAG: ATP-binding protein [Verrucomicrobiae bacterium]|nr:ATP-binding protein [Verrucomicrobiae bacterium]